MRAAALAGVDNLVSTCTDFITQGKDNKYPAIVNTVNVLDSLSNFSTSDEWMNKKEILTWLNRPARNWTRLYASTS